MIKKLLIIAFSFATISAYSFADYPNTSIGVIDINRILTEAKAAVQAAKQIEEIAIKIEDEIKESDKEIINEQNQLIEAQAIMAPEAFEAKRKEYESRVNNYNSERQAKLMKIDELIAVARNDVLIALKPILEEISNEMGITILLEKESVYLSADKMDISDAVLKKLNKELPKIEVSRD